jgi:hypothetical protein
MQSDALTASSGLVRAMPSSLLCGQRLCKTRRDFRDLIIGRRYEDKVCVGE